MNPCGSEGGVHSSPILPRSAWPWSLHYDQNRHLLFSVLAHSQKKPGTSGTRRCSGRIGNFSSPVCCGEVVCQQQSWPVIAFVSEEEIDMDEEDGFKGCWRMWVLSGEECRWRNTVSDRLLHNKGTFLLCTRSKTLNRDYYKYTLLLQSVSFGCWQAGRCPGKLSHTGQESIAVIVDIDCDHALGITSSDP